ncbi:hypothetical protein CF326_g5497 [Tilletia indica]|nr:hypothetical protein CF326_g5497 [Tilletia indica]
MAINYQELLRAGVLDRQKNLIKLPRTDTITGAEPNLDEGRFEIAQIASVKYWCKVAGIYIAEQLGLPTPTVWRLAALPEGYHLFEVWGEPQLTPMESAKYTMTLFSDSNKPFVKPAAFAPHALWLCLDPKKNKCKCHNCTSRLNSRDEDGEARGIMLNPPGPDPYLPQAEPYLASAYQRVWASTRERQDELLPVTLKGKTFQRLRPNELVWFQLPKPLVSPDRTLNIAYWPAHISSREIRSKVTQQAWSSVIDDSDDEMSIDNDNDFDLENNVVQEERYRIQLLGIRQETVTARSRLLPQLSYRPPANLLKAPLKNVPLDKLQWLSRDKRPKWQLAPSVEALLFPENSAGRTERLRARPTFDEALPAYYLAVCILSYLCTAVVDAESFALDPDLALSKPTPTHLALRKEVMETIRSSWIIPKRHLWPEFGPLNATPPTWKNTYLQGVILGADRIWVADVVRLDVQESDFDRLHQEIARTSAGALSNQDLAALKKIRRAFLMDLDAIVYPESTGSPDAERNLLFCGSIMVALHRERDADLIIRLGSAVRSTPHGDPTTSKPPGYSLEWTRPRTSLLHTGKLAFSPDMVFVPLLDAKKGFVAALPFTLIAGRWHPSSESLALEGKGKRLYSHMNIYNGLMEKLDAAPTPDSELDLTPAERALVVEGWAPGGKSSMGCQNGWASLLELHDQVERTAKVEICEMLEEESRKRLAKRA